MSQDQIRGKRKWAEFTEQTAGGDNVVVRMPAGTTYATARHQDLATSSSSGDTGIIVGMTEDACVLEFEDGKREVCSWTEISLAAVRPDDKELPKLNDGGPPALQHIGVDDGLLEQAITAYPLGRGLDDLQQRTTNVLDFVEEVIDTAAHLKRLLERNTVVELPESTREDISLLLTLVQGNAGHAVAAIRDFMSRKLFDRQRRNDDYEVDHAMKLLLGVVASIDQEEPLFLGKIHGRLAAWEIYERDRMVKSAQGIMSSLRRLQGIADYVGSTPTHVVPNPWTDLENEVAALWTRAGHLSDITNVDEKEVEDVDAAFRELKCNIGNIGDSSVHEWLASTLMRDYPTPDPDPDATDDTQRETGVAA